MLNYSRHAALDGLSLQSQTQIIKATRAHFLGLAGQLLLPAPVNKKPETTTATTATAIATSVPKPTFGNTANAQLGNAADSIARWAVRLETELESRHNNTLLQLGSSAEPKAGKCDAAVVIAIPNFFGSLFLEGSKTNCKNIRVAVVSEYSHPRNKDQPHQAEANETAKQKQARLQANRMREEGEGLLKHASATGDAATNPSLQILKAYVPDGSDSKSRTILVPKPTSLMIPVLVAEYKRSTDLSVPNVSSTESIVAAKNQCKMYCISVCAFLGQLGIYSWPVFGLITSGTEGFLIAASLEPHGNIIRAGVQEPDATQVKAAGMGENCGVRQLIPRSL